MALDPEILIKTATERTGLSDFGADGWQVGLEQLLDAAGHDLPGDDAGAAVVEGRALNRLVTRLQIEDWYADHGAEAAAHPIQGPVVILGLPRTATTALQYLLTVDPQFRYQRMWEVASPVPPPELATEATDPRRLGSSANANERHISTADGPMEDVIALGLNFHSLDLGLPVPTFTKWCRDADLASTFAYHERVLRLLHSHRPPYRWLLKTPNLLFHVDQLVAHYPDARFLWTHRDPQRAFPSACSVIRSAQSDAVPSHVSDPHALGRYLLDHWVQGTNRAMAARDSLGEGRFCDISQAQIDADAVAVVERIYDFLGLELTPEVRTNMTTWEQANKAGSRGKHSYSAEEYGLTDDTIRDAFASYTARFPL
jgi:hypothetical protein